MYRRIYRVVSVATESLGFSELLVVTLSGGLEKPADL
jgi:hypothetical protein